MCVNAPPSVNRTSAKSFSPQSCHNSFVLVIIRLCRSDAIATGIVVSRSGPSNGDINMNKLAFAAVLAGAATLAACTSTTKNETAEAANAMATDMNATASAAVNSIDAATDNAMADVSNAADAAGNKIETAADKMKAAAGNAMTDAGNTMKN